MAKRLWFSITAKDCTFQDKRGSGKGGQKKNKTSNAIQCFHAPSGAMGESEDGRSQTHNRHLAFKRMAESAEFQAWLRLKIEAGRDRIDITEKTDLGAVVTRKLRMDEV